jgi:hypothetical protein
MSNGLITTDVSHYKNASLGVVEAHAHPEAILDELIEDECELEIT